MRLCVVAVADSKRLKEIKNIIENAKINSSRLAISNGEISFETETEYNQILQLLPENIHFSLTEKLQTETVKNSIPILPKRFSIYPPLLLLPPSTCSSIEKLSNEVYKEILQHYSNLAPGKTTLTHLAINRPIPLNNEAVDSELEENTLRSPSSLTVLYGDFSNFWCHTIQNGIYQTWMPTYTMFSRGNIKEKARILAPSKFDNENLKDGRILPFKKVQGTVLDLYAGIGYFTLSYLHRGARVLCWEINEFSVEGLRRAVQKNNFGQCYIIKKNEPIDPLKYNLASCVVFLESNEYLLQRLSELTRFGITKEKLGLSHVNLGFLPSSEPSWDVVVDCIGRWATSDEVWVHVHDNVAEGVEGEWASLVEQRYARVNGQIQWIEKVKTYAPDVWHVVGDLRCSLL